MTKQEMKNFEGSYAYSNTQNATGRLNMDNDFLIIDPDDWNNNTQTTMDYSNVTKVYKNKDGDVVIEFDDEYSQS